MSASSKRPIPVGKLVTATSRSSPRGDKPPTVPLLRAKMPWLAVLLIGGSAFWLVAIAVLSFAGVVAETHEKRQNIEIAEARKLLPAAPAPRDIAPDFAPVRPAAPPGMPAIPGVHAIPAMPDLQFVPPQAPLDLFDVEKLPPLREALPEPMIELAPRQDAAALPLLEPAVKAVDPAIVPCDKLGTRIVFYKSPVDAFKQAKKENKLVYMMHLSGNFEDTAFT